MRKSRLRSKKNIWNPLDVFDLDNRTGVFSSALVCAIESVPVIMKVCCVSRPSALSKGFVPKAIVSLTASGICVFVVSGSGLVALIGGLGMGLIGPDLINVSGETVGEVGFAEIGGLAGLYLRSNGFPEVCPQTTEVKASNTAIPRMRIMGAKVATSTELNYLLQASLSKIEVSPATSSPAVVPVDAQMVFPA